MPIRAMYPAAPAAAAASFGAPFGAGPPSPPVMLAVPLIQQQGTYWCWAACTEMVNAKLNNPAITQCFLAGRLFNVPACCGAAQAQCDLSCSGGDIVTVYGWIGVNANSLISAASENVLQNELSMGRPVEAGWVWSGADQGGHVVLITGFKEVPGLGIFYRLNDPGAQAIDDNVSYADLKNAQGGGSWDYSWTNLG